MMKSSIMITFFVVLLICSTESLFAVGHVHSGRGVDAVEQTDEQFEAFLKRFTTSASFQLSRVKFPLENPITLLTEEGDEKTYPFTKEKWPLLNEESFKVEREALEEGEVYLAHYVVDTPTRKEYEAGLEESELDLRVVFELIGGKWYVTDCYNSWYSFNLPPEELKETIRQVQEENTLFKEEHP